MRIHLIAITAALLTGTTTAAEPDDSKSLFQRNREATRAAQDRGDLGNKPAAQGYNMPKRESNTVQEKLLREEERRIQRDEQGRGPNSMPGAKSAK